MPLPQNLANHKAIDTYYNALATYHSQDVTHEQATRLAFSTLLDTLSKTVGWTLVLEQTLHNRKRPDGTLQDSFKLPRGYWEAKDTHDDLDAEIKAKIARGYPLTNIIFEDTRRAVLYQNSRPVFEADLTQRSQLVALLTQFFTYTGEQIEEFNAAVQKFKDDIPELARGLMARIEEERAQNKRFVGAFEEFQRICRASIDPEISVAEIEEMLVQHLLTERLFRTVFNDPDFTDRNVIAVEIEKVIRALTSRSFNRSAFLKSLDYFYLAIEDAARTIGDYTQKQTFLNTVYERFFQGFSKDQADTHGIVYTPQPIVDFMIASVDEVLQQEFGLSLSSEGVKILDPATGTGNFIVNILRRINRRDLKRKYREELFANEIMLLPYYIASLNIEHAYYELANEYEPFEGICFADTLDLAESQQLSLFAEENTERVARQKDAEITVIIGNPPYNTNQHNENRNNKNRQYKVVDKQVRDTYAKDSKATNKNFLSDPYVKFFQWATHRLQGRDGVVCYVSNNSFVEDIPFDGMRKHLSQNFNMIYYVDLHGNVRRNPKLSGTTHNVFGIQVGVGIIIAVRNSKQEDKFIRYFRVPELWTKNQKLAFLSEMGSYERIEWEELYLDNRYNWSAQNSLSDFADFIPIGDKYVKQDLDPTEKSMFRAYSPGAQTNRDDWMYDFDIKGLATKASSMIETYNSELSRWIRSGSPSNIDGFVTNDETKIKWSSRLKECFARKVQAAFDSRSLRRSLYRPFTRQYLYFDSIMTHRQGLFPRFLPTPESEKENVVIVVTGHSQIPFSCQITRIIPSLDVGGRPSQCFPFYTYDEDGTNRRENITDWALRQFQEQYGPEVTKRDIFHYVYAVLHSPQYRERYAENLKRELPRIPLTPALSQGEREKTAMGGEAAAMASNAEATRSDAETTRSGAAAVESSEHLPPSPAGRRDADEGNKPTDAGRATFQRFVAIGAQLTDLHLGYEQAKEYPLQWIENKDVPFSWRVAKMQLSKDKTQIKVNESLTLAGIPAACFEYRLGNRSALEWVIDQYQVSTDKRSGITSDPNRADDEEYIVRLVGRVVTVSVETVKLVKALPLVVEEVPI